MRLLWSSDNLAKRDCETVRLGLRVCAYPIKHVELLWWWHGNYFDKCFIILVTDHIHESILVPIHALKIATTISLHALEIPTIRHIIVLSIQEMVSVTYLCVYTWLGGGIILIPHSFSRTWQCSHFPFIHQVILEAKESKVLEASIEMCCSV